MSDVQEKLPHTAISTWSGFVYQGKIALLHCLNLIHKYNTSVSDYKLKLENIDDFAIHDTNDICLSMHQVKAYKDTNYSTYKKAIEKQSIDSKQYENIKAYFHTSKCIKDIPNDFSVTFPNIKIYIYEKNDIKHNYCNLDEIDSLLEKKIKDIYINHYNNSYKSEQHYIETTRNILENIILNKVILIHHKIQMEVTLSDRKIASQEYISFSSIFKQLERDLNDDLFNEKYFLDMLRKDIGIYYTDFCSDIDTECDDIGDFVKLDNYIGKINNLDSDGMTKFIRSILPDRKGVFTKLTDYKNQTFTCNDLKEGLFYILDQLIQSEYNCLSENPNLFSWNHSNSDYYPTALISGKRHKRKLCQKIIQNSIDNDVDFLYESGNLITSEITSSNIFNDCNCGPNSYDTSLSHKKINQFKNVSLISIEDLPKALLHERDN